MSSTPDYPVGDQLVIRRVDPRSLREQTVNAQMMTAQQFEQLVTNVKARGQLESLPYTWQPHGEGPIEIVSGHHRVRAAIAAGLREVPILVDTAEMSRSALTAKQIAHNALVGQSDEQVLRSMIDSIDNPDDLLATGLDVELLDFDRSGPPDFLGPPTVDFEWRTVAMTFVPANLRRFRELIESMDGRVDLLAVAPIDQWDEFVAAVAEYQRVRDVLSVGTAVGRLITLAHAEIAAEVGAPDDLGEEDWVPIRDVIGTARIPPAAAEVIASLVESLKLRGDIGDDNAWQALEYAAAETLGGL